MTKLDRAKRFLNQTAGLGLRVLSLALLAASAYAQGTVYNASGSFLDSSDTLGGTITISSSGIVSEDLTVTTGNPGNTVNTGQDLQFLTYTFTGVNDGIGPESVSGGSGAPFYDNAVFFGNSNSELVLDIYLGNTDGFDDYNGGNLCGEDLFCGTGNLTSFSIIEGQLPSDPNLTVGALSPATPEPSTALLAIGGGVAVLTLRRRKRRA